MASDKLIGKFNKRQIRIALLDALMTPGLAESVLEAIQFELLGDSNPR